MVDVLVVEDDADIRNVVSLFLRAEGFCVRTAATGNAGLAAVLERAPDCVVLDAMLPGLDGFDVLATLRDRSDSGETRVVMLTCRAGEPDFIRAWNLGADAYLTKPFEPEQLVRAINEVVITPASVLKARREAELQKAKLLSRLESAFFIDD